MRALTENLFTNWHFMRWLRLGLGIFVAIQAVQLHDALAGMVAALLLLQVVTNTGCCGAGGCSVPATKTKENQDEMVSYEEVKSSKE